MDSLNGAELDPDQREHAGARRRAIAGERRDRSAGTAGPAVISHYNIVPVIDVYGGVSGRDLGGVLSDLKAIDGRSGKGIAARKLHHAARPGGDDAFELSSGLGVGLVMAMILIYLLLVVNFQSWLDPFIIITALPGGLGWRGLGLAHNPHHLERACVDGSHHEPGCRHR